MMSHVSHWSDALATILRCFGKVSRVWSCCSDMLRWITLRNLKRSQKHETILKPNPSTIPTACTVDASVFCIARTACSWDFVVQWCAEVLRKDRKAEVPDCTALNCHGSSCSSKQTQQNDSSWTTSIESTVASHRSRIREPESRCAPCLKAHLNFQFHLFLDLGHLSSSQQKPRDSVLLVQILRTFCPQVPCEDRWPARRQIVFWQKQKRLQQNRQNVRNSKENSNDNHDLLMKRIDDVLKHNNRFYTDYTTI